RLARDHQSLNISPTGQVLMPPGNKGFKGNGPDTFDQPSGIAVAPNGDIFVTDGHGKNDRVVKFSKDGRFIKTWGHHGSGPGEFDQPHDISIGGSQGRVFVADRSNSRVQIFDQDGNFIAAWKQFGRPSAVFVSKDDTLYVSHRPFSTGSIRRSAPASSSVKRYNKPSGPCCTSRMRCLSSVRSG